LGPSPVIVGAVTASNLEGAEIVRINDNRGSKYSLVKLPDNSVVATNPDLYPRGTPTDWENRPSQGPPAAISDIRPTDVLVLDLNKLDLVGGSICTDPFRTPAGKSALRSFAEVFRRGCQLHLDIRSEELECGLQEAATGSFRTARVFLADAHDNGAGYAAKLGSATNIKAVLDAICDQLGPNSFEAPSHSDCTTSCPDCLRSWDNRRLHGFYDWRLALDVAALARGEPLSTRRWFSRAPQLITTFFAAFSQHLDLTTTTVRGLPAITRSDGSAAVLLGHPLWQLDGHLNGTQADAAVELGFNFASVVVSDLFVLARTPIKIFRQLAD